MKMERTLRTLLNPIPHCGTPPEFRSDKVNTIIKNLHLIKATHMLRYQIPLRAQTE